MIIVWSEIHTEELKGEGFEAVATNPTFSQMIRAVLTIRFTHIKVRWQPVEMP